MQTGFIARQSNHKNKSKTLFKTGKQVFFSSMNDFSEVSLEVSETTSRLVLRIKALWNERLTSDHS